MLVENFRIVSCFMNYCFPFVSAYPPTPLYVEAITEERASRCIARIDLLSKIREEIIVHAKLRERIMLCKTSYDLPSWWINGFHDRELLIGAAK